MDTAPFGKEFLWGAATAAYQIEGGVREGGRGTSIWDTFSHTPGRTRDGATGDVACDHYHLYRQDVALMKELGANAYRFSIAWPRIVPDGVGPTSSVGVDFYSRLVDELLAAGIVPCATLYHWDLPQSLEDRGGWRNRETADRFADYAARVVALLGNRVGCWITLNEPQVVAICGHEIGVHAPGLCDKQAALIVDHVLNLAHGKAIPAMRAADPTGKARMGITLNLARVYPAGQGEADHRAADLFDARFYRWYLDPTFRKSYPADAVEFYGRDYILPRLDAGDADLLSPPIDFLGVNNYSRHVIRAENGDPTRPQQVRQPASVYTTMDWEVAPAGLRDILIQVHRQYGPKQIMVTENGASFEDAPDAAGRVRDEPRVAFLRDYIAAAGEAIEAGVPLAGYFVWSLLDNFEWGQGYSKRFGIVRVDYRTQRRTVKDSGRWYQQWIAQWRD